jgi:sugar phosphate isomerase/epimerase
MRKIAKDMFYNVDMVSLEEIYIAITGRRHPGYAKGEILWHEIHRALRARGFDGLSIYLGAEDGHIAVYDAEKHERIRVNDASEILDLLEKLKGK